MEKVRRGLWNCRLCRSADSLVRELKLSPNEHADKAVRAPTKPNFALVIRRVAVSFCGLL